MKYEIGNIKHIEQLELERRIKKEKNISRKEKLLKILNENYERKL